jgi:hypothetical protein
MTGSKAFYEDLVCELGAILEATQGQKRQSGSYRVEGWDYGIWDQGLGFSFGFGDQGETMAGLLQLVDSECSWPTRRPATPCVAGSIPAGLAPEVDSAVTLASPVPHPLAGQSDSIQPKRDDECNRKFETAARTRPYRCCSDCNSGSLECNLDLGILVVSNFNNQSTVNHPIVTVPPCLMQVFLWMFSHLGENADDR